ncbi:hypothetical protein HMPREF2532_01545 [Bacteroides ovatus]|jgi:hypothetical protein|nr:hypothetical protein HMPREF2532_01545 [Bacteroides ovatus]CAG9881611.1 hypothetical protein BOVA711_4518 [Bacteroides ovatus]CAG9908240.1 hypothetical protein BOVAC16_427 [Bacteroides ovatus]
MNKLFAGEGRASHYRIHHITYRKNVITVLSKIIALIVANTAMFFLIIPMKKIIY